MIAVLTFIIGMLCGFLLKKKKHYKQIIALKNYNEMMSRINFKTIDNLRDEITILETNRDYWRRIATAYRFRTNIDLE